MEGVSEGDNDGDKDIVDSVQQSTCKKLKEEDGISEDITVDNSDDPKLTG